MDNLTDKQEDDFDIELVKVFANHIFDIDSFHNFLKLEWANRAAAHLANNLYSMLYKPDEINQQMKGWVSWRPIKALFNRNTRLDYLELTIYDRISRVYFVPTLHMKYLTLTIPYQLKYLTVEQLNHISTDVSYEDEQLTVAGDFPGTAIALLAVVKRVDHRRLELEDSHETYKLWSKIVYNEWKKVFYGEPLDKACILTSVLEKYVLS